MMSRRSPMSTMCRAGRLDESLYVLLAEVGSAAGAAVETSSTRMKETIDADSESFALEELHDE
jgi:hypothetical protein